jgi:hypothetical protein
VAALTLSACADIWNASDLALWVRDQAVAEGCERETIELDDWYTAEGEHNVWHGTCRDAQGNAKAFGINVDPVWTPSRSEPYRGLASDRRSLIVDIKRRARIAIVVVVVVVVVIVLVVDAASRGRCGSAWRTIDGDRDHDNEKDNEERDSSARISRPRSI